MLTPMLADAFNHCTDKIVHAAELMERSFNEYAAKLSPKEREQVSAFKAEMDAAIKEILGNQTHRQKLMAAVGDGSLGIYTCSKQRVFVNTRFVKFMEETMRGKMNAQFSPELISKLDSADATALLKAQDHKGTALRALKA